MDVQLKADLPDRVCGVRFYPRSLRLIREIIEDASGSTRAEITRQVCDRLGWVDVMGRSKTVSAGVALKDFHQRGWITLPETQPSSRSGNVWGLPDPDRLPGSPIEGALQDLGDLQLQLVTSPEDVRFSQSLLAHHHYRGALIAFGAQRRYLIQSSKGCLGTMVFSAAARQLRDRDQWIGWNQAIRRERRQ